MSNNLRQRRTALLTGCAIISATTGLVVAPPGARAQTAFVCGGSATGAEPQTGAGATVGNFGGVACGPNASASFGGVAVGEGSKATGDPIGGGTGNTAVGYFGGPLRDTLIQRWRDPVDGTICYLYLPILGAHSAPGASGYVEYGANTIGSISCSLVPGAGSTARPAPVPPGPPPQR